VCDIFKYTPGNNKRGSILALLAYSGQVEGVIERDTLNLILSIITISLKKRAKPG
jgi:hypothetical protein